MGAKKLRISIANNLSSTTFWNSGCCLLCFCEEAIQFDAGKAEKYPPHTLLVKKSAERNQN
jgi:hypothetical protein